MFRNFSFQRAIENFNLNQSVKWWVLEILSIPPSQSLSFSIESHTISKTAETNNTKLDYISDSSLTKRVPLKVPQLQVSSLEKYIKHRYTVYLVWPAIVHEHQDFKNGKQRKWARGQCYLSSFASQSILRRTGRPTEISPRSYYLTRMGWTDPASGAWPPRINLLVLQWQRHSPAHIHPLLIPNGDGQDRCKDSKTSRRL